MFRGVCSCIKSSHVVMFTTGKVSCKIEVLPHNLDFPCNIYSWYYYKESFMQSQSSEVLNKFSPCITTCLHRHVYCVTIIYLPVLNGHMLTAMLLISSLSSSMSMIKGVARVDVGGSNKSFFLALPNLHKDYIATLYTCRVCIWMSKQQLFQITVQIAVQSLPHKTLTTPLVILVVGE